MGKQEIYCSFLLTACFNSCQQGRVIKHGCQVEQSFEPLPRLVRISGVVDLVSQIAKRLSEFAAEALAARKPVNAKIKFAQIGCVHGQHDHGPLVLALGRQFEVQCDVALADPARNGNFHLAPAIADYALRQQRRAARVDPAERRMRTGQRRNLGGDLVHGTTHFIGCQAARLAPTASRQDHEQQGRHQIAHGQLPYCLPEVPSPPASSPRASSIGAEASSARSLSL